MIAKLQKRFCCKLLRGDPNPLTAFITARTVTHNYFRSSNSLRESKRLLRANIKVDIDKPGNINIFYENNLQGMSLFT